MIAKFLPIILLGLFVLFMTTFNKLEVVIIGLLFMVIIPALVFSSKWLFGLRRRKRSTSLRSMRLLIIFLSFISLVISLLTVFASNASAEVSLATILGTALLTLTPLYLWWRFASAFIEQGWRW
jgi:hypothetical protein